MPTNTLVGLVAFSEVAGDQGVQPSQPRDPRKEPSTGQHPALDIHQLDVVMNLRPVVPDEQHLDNLLSTASR
jgi:hypothetical protein